MEITNKQFMTIGSIVFFIIATAGLISLVTYWGLYNPFQRISSIASTFFNYLISFMFTVWRKQQGEVMEEITEANNIEEIVNEIERKTKKLKKNGK